MAGILTERVGSVFGSRRLDEMVSPLSGRHRDRFSGTARRRFLKSALGALIALPAGTAFAASGTGLAGTGLSGPGLPEVNPAGAVARRLGSHFLVEGWVLTKADLEALGIAVPAPDARVDPAWEMPRRGAFA